MSVALLEYLQAQPGVTFKRLYQEPATVLAVLRRMMPHLGAFFGRETPRTAKLSSENHRNGHDLHARALPRIRPFHMD
jgi:hypothetical protein